jgi:hypothetical protein
MNDLHFQKLKSLVDNGRLKTYIIIAPPRTNSSLVEHALGNSSDIKHECHEPFLNARHEDFDTDHGYQQIYESIGGEKFERSGKKTSVVIKEMSHWIAKGGEYKRLIGITTKPIIVLIRDPLLSVESRIRRVLTTMDMRYNVSTQRHLLDEMAIEKGFQNWAEFADKMKQEGYKERPDFLENKESVERIYDTPVLTVQNNLLDIKARVNGYANWRDLVDKKLYTERDYKFFEGILGSNERRLEFEKGEFSKLAEEVTYLETQEKDYFVFDTTDLRIAPDEQMQELCSKLGVAFSSEMTRWGEKPVDFHTEQTQEYERLWYDTLYSSSRVNPPVEIPPTLDRFPTFTQTYLKENNLPTYAVLSKKKVLSKELRRELNEREMRVKVTKGNRDYLHELGLIDEKIAIGEHVLVKLKYIDPIYAILNDPELTANSEFKLCRDIYAEEIKIVLENFAEINEHTREIRGLNKENRLR